MLLISVELGAADSGINSCHSLLNGFRRLWVNMISPEFYFAFILAIRSFV